MKKKDNPISREEHIDILSNEDKNLFINAFQLYDFNEDDNIISVKTNIKETYNNILNKKI